MVKSATAIFEDIETVAIRSSWIHSIDARAKIIVTISFLATLASFDSHAVSDLFPMGLFIVAWASMGSVSLRWLIKKLAIPVTLLAIFGLANIFFDRRLQGSVLGITFTSGFLSWCSIVLRAFLSLGIVLLLMATTGIVRLSRALAALKVPQIVVTTLLLLYRYIFVLSDEALRMNRARNSRSFGKRGLEISTASALLGQLLTRSLSRADRIHNAMIARGFAEKKAAAVGTKWSLNETALTCFALLFFVAVRIGNFPTALGKIFMGAF